MSTTQKITYYILLILTSVLFLYSGYSKVTAVPEVIQGFQTAHLPIWFMYFIGVCEILGAIGLLIRKLQRMAAYGLFIILAGAIVTSALFVNMLTALFPLIVAIILGSVVWLGKKKAHQASSANAATKTSETVSQMSTTKNS